MEPINLDRGPAAQALYAQLIEYFRDRINRGALPPGSRLPTEWELVEQFNLSRNTVRQAMNALVSAGLLERTQGRGTFVRAVEPVPASEPQTPSREKRIGLVLSHAGDQLNMELLLGVEQAAKSHGYDVSFSYSEENGELQSRDVARMRAGGVCGFILFPLSDEEEDQAIARLCADGTPLVLIDRHLPKQPTDYVGVDNYNGGYRATEHLCILGHTRIGFAYQRVGGLTTSSVHDRWRGYRQALLDYGREYDERLVIQGEAQSILAMPDRPSAVFASNDEHALALLRAARNAGLRVPEDIAVVGFDDLSFAQWTMPALTTVAQPRHDAGAAAAHLLISRIEGQTGAVKHIELPTHLVVRDSCGAKLRVREQQAMGHAAA